MGSRFDVLHGWRSPGLRVVVLTFGWMLVVLAAAAIVVGLVSSNTPTLMGGMALGGSARLASWLAPEPLPSARKEVRKRVASLEKLAGHELPGESRPRGSVQ